MVTEIGKKFKKITDIVHKYEREIGKHTYCLVKTPLITDRAIAEKIAEKHRWKYLGIRFGYARIITKKHNKQEYFLVYRFLDTTPLYIAYYNIGESVESKK